MATFGRFETVREIHRMGYVVVYSARTPDSTAERYAIKVFQPPALMLEGERAKTEIELFLKSAAVQHKVAAGGAPHWAPIHQHGSTAEGAFYVTNRHEHSLRRLIDLRLKLNSTDLSVVIGAVVEGLMELKCSCRRPHGDLKAANVLVGGTGDISQRNVVLCDPLPDEYVDTSVHWDTDLLGVAEFIYELVVHRPSPRLDGWQAPDSQEWRRLGKQATAWRNLCNRLFKAAVAPGTITLETVAEELAQIARAKPARRYHWPVAAGAVVIVLAVVLFMLLKPKPPDEVTWERLCRAYTDWFEDLENYQQDKDDSYYYKKRWRKQNDRNLAQILDEIETARYLYDFGQTIASVKKKPPPKVTNKGTTKALDAIYRIRAFFDVNDPNSDNPWPLLVQLDETANRFRQRQWEEPADYLTLLVHSPKPEPNKPVGDNVDKILALRSRAILGDIEALWGKVQGDVKAITGSQDPVLARFDDYVRMQLRSGPPADYEDKRKTLPFEPDAMEQAVTNSLAELRNKLGSQDVNGLAGELAEFLTETWADPEKFDKAQFSEDDEQVPPASPTAATFRDRLETMRGYCVIPDPRGKFRASVANIKKLMKVAKAANPEEADQCDREFAAFESTPAFKILTTGKTIVKKELAIKAALDAHMPELLKIERRVKAAAETVEAYRDRIAKTKLDVELEQVEDKWSALRDALLNSDKYQDIKQTSADYAEKYTDLRRKMGAVESGLVSLDRKLHRELPVEIGLKLRSDPNDDKIEPFYHRHRREATERILAEIPLRDGVPDINDGAFTEQCRDEFTAVNDLRTTLRALVVAFNTIEGHLDLYYRYREEFEPEVQDARTVAALWQKWEEYISGEPEISDALKELTDRIETLREIESANRAKLIGIATDTNSPAQAIYAAWHQLGVADGSWPSTTQDWETERGIQEDLAVRFGSLEEDRKRELRVMLASKSFRRHQKIIRANTQKDETLKAFAALQPPGEASLNDLDALEQLAEKLGDFVVDPNWQNGRYDTSTFTDPNGQDNIFADNVGRTDTAMRAWLGEVKNNYLVITDPRDPNSWQTKISEFREMIVEGIEDSQDANDTLLLEGDRTALDELDARFKEIKGWPAITKHQEKIKTWHNLWGKDVPDLEDRIISHIRPAYCQYLEIADAKLAFRTDLELGAFEPVAYDKNDFNAVSLANLREFEKQQDATLKENFFDARSLEESDTQNFGWPKYIRFKPDPSLRLRFVPGDPAQNIPPFYMALHEITNAQYARFLNDKKAIGGRSGGSVRDSQTREVWIARHRAAAVDQGCLRIRNTGGQFTVERQYQEHPVIWITVLGAEAYAKWLDETVVRLPRASWHRHATAYGNVTNSHVRGAKWLEAVDKWRQFLALEPDGATESPPLGAADQAYCDDALNPANFATLPEGPIDPNQVVDRDERSNTYLPRPVPSDDRADLCDLLGNTWEWCETNTGTYVLCGGSCLSGPEHAKVEAELQHPSTKSSRDVGFRVVVVPPTQ